MRGRKGLAAGLTVALLTVVVLIPVLAFIVVLAQQAADKGLALRIQHQRTAVEHQFILTADQVHIRDRDTETCRSIGHQRLTLRALALVAVGAGVRCAQADGLRRAWDAEAVVVPGIDDHVVRRRHVTLDAARASAAASAASSMATSVVQSLRTAYRMGWLPSR